MLAHQEQAGTPVPLLKLKHGWEPSALNPWTGRTAGPARTDNPRCRPGRGATARPRSPCVAFLTPSSWAGVGGFDWPRGWLAVSILFAASANGGPFTRRQSLHYS